MNSTNEPSLEIPHGVFLRDAENKTHRKEYGKRITRDWKFPVLVALVPPGWYDEPRDYHLNPQAFGKYNTFEELKEFLEKDLPDEMTHFLKWCKEH